MQAGNLFGADFFSFWTLTPFHRKNKLRLRVIVYCRIQGTFEALKD